MAKVYRAMLSGPMGFEKEVALKKIDSRLTQDDRFVKALINEARLGGQLRHKNIVEVYEFNQVDGDYYLAMEFVDGWTLDAFLRECRKAQRWVPPSVVMEIAVQVCWGLDFAHSLRAKDGQEMHLVHRDLKPANIILSRSGDAKIMDFGIAKADSNLYKTTAADVTKGTPIYMSPEQVRGESLDARSDLFSLGSILHEMATLRVVFSGDQLLTIMHKVLQADISEAVSRADERIPGLGNILQRSMARRPEDRYSGAVELARDLEKLRAAVLRNDPGPSLYEFLRDFEAWGSPRPSLSHSDSSPSVQVEVEDVPTGTQSLASVEEGESGKGNSGSMGSMTRAFFDGGTSPTRPTGPVPIGPPAGVDRPPSGPARASIGGSLGNTTRARDFYDTTADPPPPSPQTGTRRQLFLVASLGSLVALLVVAVMMYVTRDPGSEPEGTASPGTASAVETTPPPGPGVPGQGGTVVETTGAASTETMAPEPNPPPTPEDTPTSPSPGGSQSLSAEEQKKAEAAEAKKKAEAEAKKKAATEEKKRLELEKLAAADPDHPTTANPDPPPQLNPAGRAKMDINARPWAHVYLDGQPLGQTPKKGWEISAGTHTVMVRCGPCSTPQQKEFTFTVNPGGFYGNTSIRFDQ